MKVHVVDGTYELFRHYFGAPPAKDVEGREVGAVLGVARSLLGMVRGGATHVGVATDHIVESFRNDLWAGYKTGDGIEPDLWNQFHPLEDTLRDLGFVVWAMVEQEADDAMASAAAKASALPEVDQVVICTPDKDLGQCVVGDRVVQLDRRAGTIRNEAGVVEKFGVLPRSIPDYLALVGDAADGFPGIPGWGAKSASAVIGRYEHLENIPRNPAQWGTPLRGAERLADALFSRWDEALLFRTLATLRTDHPVFESLEELRWKGAPPKYRETARRLESPELADLVERTAADRGF